jgi:hypothetical protein
MVKPDESLLQNELFEVVNAESEQCMVLKDPDSKKGFVSYKWDQHAWRADLRSDKHGILLFARKDKQPLTSELLTDLFNYIYEMMEYYHNGKRHPHSLKHLQHMCSPESFTSFTFDMDTQTRRDMAKSNLRKVIFVFCFGSLINKTVFKF